MRVRFWGARGSIATPGPSTLRYGGNTACVEVRTDDGTLLIFDCGTGARGLGLGLVQEGGPLLVCIDLQPYATVQAPDRSDILNVGGFSDAVFEVVASFLASDAGHFVQEVEAVEL